MILENDASTDWQLEQRKRGTGKKEEEEGEKDGSKLCYRKISKAVQSH
jgi:hypothetical protein